MARTSSAADAHNLPGGLPFIESPTNPRRSINDEGNGCSTHPMFVLLMP